METFKTLLFGVSGLSMIFWVAVIAMWHVDMFPRVFAQDSLQGLDLNNTSASMRGKASLPANSGELRPDGDTKALRNRGKYSRKSFVVADFAPIEDGYSVNRLYTSLILNLGIMSFMVLGYGLHSGLSLPS